MNSCIKHPDNQSVILYIVTMLAVPKCKEQFTKVGNFGLIFVCMHNNLLYPPNWKSCGDQKFWRASIIILF